MASTPPPTSSSALQAVNELVAILNEYLWDSTTRTHYFNVVGSTVDKGPVFQNMVDPVEMQPLSNLEKKLYMIAKRAFPDLVAQQTDCRIELVHEYSALPATVTMRGGKNIAQVLYERYPQSIFPDAVARLMVQKMLEVTPAYDHFWTYVPLKRIPTWHPSVRFPYDAERNRYANETWLCADAMLRMWQLCMSSISGMPSGYMPTLGIGALTFLMVNDFLRGNECARHANTVYNHVYSQCLFFPLGCAPAVDKEYSRNRLPFLCGDVGEISKVAVNVLRVDSSFLLVPVADELRLPPFAVDALLRWKDVPNADAMVEQVVNMHLFSLPNAEDVIAHLLKDKQAHEDVKRARGWIEFKPSAVAGLGFNVLSAIGVSAFTYRPFLFYHPPINAVNSHFAASLYRRGGKTPLLNSSKAVSIPLTVSESMRILYSLIVPRIETPAAAVAY